MRASLNEFVLACSLYNWYSGSNGKFEDFMKKNNYPKSLILPAQATLCLGGGFLWPISLPIMVIIEKLNKV